MKMLHFHEVARSKETGMAEKERRRFYDYDVQTS